MKVTFAALLTMTAFRREFFPCNAAIFPCKLQIVSLQEPGFFPASRPGDFSTKCLPILGKFGATPQPLTGPQASEPSNIFAISDMRRILFGALTPPTSSQANGSSSLFAALCGGAATKALGPQDCCSRQLML
jgi:hypothetical protein